MASSLEDVLQQLRDVQARLDGLPADAFLRRIELKDRLNDLRANAAELRVGTDFEGSTSELVARLANLQRQRDGARRSRVDTVKQGALGFTPDLNRAVDRGTGLSDLDEQIDHLEQILVARGVELE